MSTPGAPREGGREREGFGRYIRRFKTILRRRPTTAGSSASPASPTSAEDPPATTITRSDAPSPRVDAVSTTAVAQPVRSLSAAVVPLDAQAADRYEKIKAMFAKYNIDFDEVAFPNQTLGQAARVEKPIRMRVRFICHSCQANYSASKVCTNCQHRRCSQCTRIPPKKRKKGKEKSDGKKAAEGREKAVPPSGDAGVLSADTRDEAEVLRSGLKFVPKKPKQRKETALTIPSRTGGQDLVRKEPLQRIHRTCCQCQSSFVRESKECPQCNHLRCTKCPREPAKRDKWPDGYPGDVIPPEPERTERQWRKQRVRVRWTCHECQKVFVAGQDQCANCSHTRCSDCERDPPPRERGEFSDEAVQSVREKLANVGLTTESSDPANKPMTVAPTTEERGAAAEVPKAP